MQDMLSACGRKVDGFAPACAGSGRKESPGDQGGATERVLPLVPKARGVTVIRNRPQHRPKCRAHDQQPLFPILDARAV